MNTTRLADLTIEDLRAIIREEIERVLHPTKAEAKPKKGLTLEEAGLTHEQALQSRMLFAAIAEDWDDPSMDVYDAD